MVRAMINSVDSTPTALRPTLGSIAYDHIKNALNEWIAALEAQKEVAGLQRLNDRHRMSQATQQARRPA